MFQVKRLPSGTSGGPEPCIARSVPPPNPVVLPQPEVHHEQTQGQLPLQPPPPSQPQLRPHPLHPQSQSYPHQQPHAGPSRGAGEPAVVHSHRGSPLHLSADSACSSSSLPGRGSMLKPPDYATVGRKCHPNVTSAGMGRVAGLTTSSSRLMWMYSRGGLGEDSRLSLTDTSQIKQRMFSQLDYMQKANRYTVALVLVQANVWAASKTLTDLEHNQIKMLDNTTT